MWKVGEHVTVSGYFKHKAVVKECKFEYHRIGANAQRNKFKEAKENLPEGCFLEGEGIADISRA